MATSSMIPYSNPAGKNQTSPSVQGTVAQPTTLPGATPGASATATPTTATSNPLIPAVASGGAVPSVTSDSLGSELSDIFGSGVGGAASSFLGSISGTDSVILQEYIKSLGPQMATAQAQTNAALGAGGVSANSSVAAIADANLQAQEFSSIAQESAALTQSGMSMEENMIQSMFGPAENYENAQQMMPWEILGAGVGAAGSIASAGIKAGVI